MNFQGQILSVIVVHQTAVFVLLVWATVTQ